MESLALTETCLDIKFYIYWYYSYLVTRLQEEEEEEKEREEKHGQNGKIILGYNFHIWYFFTDIFGIQFSFLIFSIIKLLKVKMT